MRRIPKGTVICMLGAIFLLNLALRFPRTPHEIGLDSFVMHSLTDTLINNAHADWILNPLGFFGLYPLSYPSAGMFYIGSISVVLGVDTEVATFIGPMMLSFIAVAGSFLLGRELHNDVRFSLFLAFTLSTAPIFVNFTLWETPTRSLFMALTPLFLFFFMRFHKSEEMLYVVIMVLLFVVLLASHRLAAVVVLVILAYVLTFVYNYGVKILKITKPRYFMLDRYRKNLPIVLFILVCLLILALLQTSLFFGDPLSEYRTGVLFEGDNPLFPLANMFVSLARSVGIFLPLAGLGLFAVMEKPNKGFEEPFLIILLVMLVPTLYLRKYTGFYMLPVVSIFIAYGYMFIVRQLGSVSNPLKIGAVVALLVLSLGFTNFMIGYHLEGTGIFTEERYSSALYVRYMEDKTIVFNRGELASHVNSIAEKKVMPCGGATTPADAPEIIAYGFYDSGGFSVEPLPITQITVQTDYPFILEGLNSLTEYNNIMFNRIDAMDPNTGEHVQPGYVFVDNANRDSFSTGWGKEYYSRFLVDVTTSRYAVYSNSGSTIYSL